MISNFEQIKAQLAELANVINAFKSEAVQLRIVELIFQNVPTPSTQGEAPEKQRTRRRRAAKRTKTTVVGAEGEPPTKGKKARTGKAGPAAVLNELIGENYFSTKKTLGDIINHCSAKKARNFKPNELSTPLARFVRDNRLKRDKNKDGQFEYHA